MSASALQRFNDRVAKMQTSRSKEMRLPYDEAFELTVAIAELTAKLLEAQEKLERIDAPIVLSGGSFKST